MEVACTEINMVEHENWTTPLYQEPFNLLADDRWEDYLNYGIPLYKAALRGDWEAATQVHSRHSGCFAARITENGDTALHIAAIARHTDFVSKLVTLIGQTECEHLLAVKNRIGETALGLAAASGIVAIAMVMVHQHPDLPLIRGNQGLTPVHMAALLGHRKMVRYLLPLTSDYLSDEERIALFISTIDSDLYDIAVKMLDDHPELAIACDELTKETPLHALAKKRLKSCRTRLGKFCNKFNIIRGNEEIALQLLERIWGLVLKQKHNNVRRLIEHPWDVLFKAVEVGNVEFVTTLLCFYPDLIWKRNDKHLSIFHIAVKHRQEKIFRLIYEIGAIKDFLATYEEFETGNNMLHLAAMLHSSVEQNNSASVAGLQMQKEMLWFKAVKDLAPHLAEDVNSEGRTPRTLFTKEHKELRKEGEKWMKKTASSCSVVATLIAVVVFGAALKVPGTNNEASPNPLSHGGWNWAFAISDSLSLITSTASILVFLSISTSRHAEEDFLRSLPLKLNAGLTLLFMSITTMMISFTATFHIIFKHGLLWIGIAVLACIPIIMFVVQEFPLLLEVHRLTIGNAFMFNPRHRLTTGNAFIFKPRHQLFSEYHQLGPDNC